jgi:hypothetical protein
MSKELPEKKIKLVKPTISKRQHKGYVYNVTTETGNLFVEDILVHNSGGLGTPPHLRVEPGMIHRASGGVLFIDELATLSRKSQQELLTAMQEKKYSITGQSENSSGAMTRTEPVPCFPREVFLDFDNCKKRIGDFVDSQINTKKNKVVREGALEYLNINGPRVLSYLDGSIIPSKVNRVYRRKYSGKMLRIKFEDNTEIFTTPEHPIKKEKDFIKAQDLVVGDLVEAKMPEIIINSQDIIKQYSKENIHLALSYKKWKANPKISYKELGVDYKTISAWINGAVPHALKTVYWLNQKNLLPLSVNDNRLPVIARIAGALFGDGGLDSRRLSRLYFATAKDANEDIKDFCKDIKFIFGEDIEKSFSVRKTSSGNGKGLELSVSKAEIARFFYALGVPKGDKVSQKINIPWWIKYSENTKKEFFSSLITCEIYGKLRSSQDVPNFVMAKLNKFESEHISFLNELRKFLDENGVTTNEVIQCKDYIKTKNLPFPEKCGTYLFKINSNYRNLIRFSKVVNFPYSKEKREGFLMVINKGKHFVKEQDRISLMKSHAKNLKNKGLTLREISKETKISLNTVMKSVGPTYNKYSEKIKLKVMTMIKKDKSLKDIAKEFNIPYTTLLYWKNNGDINDK